MAKIDVRRLRPQTLRAIREHLWEEIQIIARRTPVLLKFLQTFLTESEHIMLARRIRTALLLTMGYSADDIRQEMGVGYTTIQFVDRALRSESADYRAVFSKIVSERERAKRVRIALCNPYSFASLRRKYPLHFLLFNLALGDSKYLWPRKQK